MSEYNPRFHLVGIAFKKLASLLKSGQQSLVGLLTIIEKGNTDLEEQAILSSSLSKILLIKSIRLRIAALRKQKDEQIKSSIQLSLSNDIFTLAIRGGYASGMSQRIWRLKWTSYKSQSR